MATSYGALDASDLTRVAEAGIDCIALPTQPSEPIGLKGEDANFWRFLSKGPVLNSDLSSKQQILVREFEAFGLASTETQDPARTTFVPKPWLIFPLHELVYALIANVARKLNIDVVFVKGPALHRQGLREHQNSGDIDVLVDPNDIEALIDQLIRWGWKVKSNIWENLLPEHSITLEPLLWGCEIDLHYNFPGIGTSGREALAILSKQSQSLHFAGTPAMVPTVEAHAVIAALNLTRPEISTHTAPLDTQAAELLKKAGIGSIEIARQLSADAALAPALATAFPANFIDSGASPPPNWRWRAQPTKIQSYFMAVQMTPIRKRPILLFRLLWPTSEAILASNIAAGGRARTGLIARSKRLLRGVKSLLLTKKRIGNIF